jgi:hypothetical protein
MASLPIFFSLAHYRTLASRGYRSGTQITGQSSHVDNPVDRVKFDDKPGGRTTDRGPVQIRERFMRGLSVRKEVKTG